MPKKKDSPHSTYAHEINGEVFLYKNGKLIRNKLFYGRARRKSIMDEYVAQIKKNQLGKDEFYITVSLKI